MAKTIHRCGYSLRRYTGHLRYIHKVFTFGIEKTLYLTLGIGTSSSVWL